MATQDLYFILNPSLGIVKIGIATHVESRRKGLECACGVPLELLAVAKGGGDFERDLLDAFGPQRLLGEWFAPSTELLELARAVATATMPAKVVISEFLRAAEQRIADWRSARHAAVAATKAGDAEAKREEREARARLQAEIRRQEKEREDRAERRRVARERAERERVEQEMAAWRTRDSALVPTVVRGREANLVEERRALIASSQKARNAANVGIPVSEGLQ